MAGLAGGFAACHGQSPFGVSASLQRDGDFPSVHVAFTIPTNTFLYADRLSFEVSGEPAPTGFVLPEQQVIQDKFSGEQKHVFGRSFEASHRLRSADFSSVSLAVRFQGCDDANCYFPEEKVFTILANGTVQAVEPAEAGESQAAKAGSWSALADAFEVRARGSGYLGERGFLALIDRAEDPAERSAVPAPERGGWGRLLTLCLIVLGGVGLNLTPCILPMIPINLAIIGAGAQAGSRQRGFALGATYALGMALAYGALGLLVVLTGSKFGTLNSSPWFNLAIALVFLVLALGMFDVLAIDLSRFQGRRGRPAGASRGKFLVAGSMGAVAALLAGACVAPVVISVLVQATALYSQGTVAGLFLPFLLGIGMGLPWPFAGAGLSFLPRPGVWMTRVKYVFGGLIVLFAAYYGWLSFSLFHTAPSPLRLASGSVAEPLSSSGSGDELFRVLDQARKDGKPVFIDFWASWCKNCSAMEHTTFKAPSVQRRLGPFLQLRFQAERLNQTGTKEVLDYFGVYGLPTFVFLEPKRGGTPAASPQTFAGVNPARAPRSTDPIAQPPAPTGLQP
jgi:thioredoxin:protein disulfide reductase